MNCIRCGAPQPYGGDSTGVCERCKVFSQSLQDCGSAPKQAPCHCVGPQNGEPVCPCAMRPILIRDGRWVQPEVDLGPIK